MQAQPLTIRHPYPMNLLDSRAAIAYNDMAHEPHRFAVELSYLHFKHETLAQFGDLLDSGLDIEYHAGLLDYANSDDMFIDIGQGGILTRLTVASGDADLMPSNHPMLQRVNIATRPLTLNDVFRTVHDVNGHYGTADTEHYSFGPNGERSAWLRHRQMYSREALLALWCETRGQSAWTNAFGAHAELPLKERPFASQKAGVPANYRELI